MFGDNDNNDHILRMSLSLCVELFELLISAFRQLIWPCGRIRLQTFSSRLVTGALQRTLKSDEITIASLFAMNVLEHWIQWRDGQYGEWWSHGFLWQREHGFSPPCAKRSIFHKNYRHDIASLSFSTLHESCQRFVHVDAVVNAPLDCEPDFEGVACSGTMVEICPELGHQHASDR